MSVCLLFLVFALFGCLGGCLVAYTVGSLFVCLPVWLLVRCVYCFVYGLLDLLIG